MAEVITTEPTNHSQQEIVEEIEGRRLDMNLGLLKIFNFYRVFVGLALLVVFYQSGVETRLGDLNPNLFVNATALYTGFNILCVIFAAIAPRKWFRHQFAFVFFVGSDILALTLLMYFSGGVSSGLGALILVSVTTGTILISGKISTLMAAPALATLAVLYEEIVLSIRNPDFVDDFFQAGVLGLLYFASSLIIQSLSKRVRENDIRALTQAVELADLERVNEQIVQRMRTGIILVDPQNHIRMINQSARGLIGLVQSEAITHLPTALSDQLFRWRDNANFRTPPFQVSPETPEIKVNFSPVRANEHAGDVTIFVEDTGEIQQQAQQLKLAALGRLSASIAHEIRNPLGAISHAAQLLKESDNVDPGDVRLTDIINNHCHRMNGVIENVLELSRRAPPVPTRLNLMTFLQKFSEEFIEAVPDAEILIDVDPEDTEVRIDESQLSQALTNLVQNGIRYSRLFNDSPTVKLQGGLDGSTDRPFLNVIDEGPGVPADQVDSLFEPFHTTERQGTGLGLYISRELCEANQARLTYNPANTGGSCFRITFAHPDRITG